MKKQSFSNHVRLQPVYHFILCPFAVITAIYSVMNLIKKLDNTDALPDAILLVAINAILGMVLIFIRYFGTKLQDRTVRSEENFRHFVLTGKPLDSRLSMSQIIALRFSPDDEFVDLCKEAAERQLTKEEIKKSIRRWKGDYHRI